MDDAAAGTLLKRMLREGTPKERESAAYMLGRSGAVAAVNTLYAALRDPEEAVRAAAHRALAELQCRTGIVLPGIT
jgi:HEAT repeat protein